MKYCKMPNGEVIAYKNFAPVAGHFPAGKLGGVVFLPGFKSDMEGSKAVFLHKICEELEVPYLRFDYYGHGDSSGMFENGSISKWAEDVVNVLDFLTKGPQLLVGSSMGGWLMLLAALKRPQNIAGLLGIAAAPDFTEDLIWYALKESEQRQLMQDGYYDLPNDYCNDPAEESEPYRITKKLIEDGRDNLLMQGKKLKINCPIYLIHGMKDIDVPFDLSIKIAESIDSKDAEIYLQKNGDHRMSSSESLKMLEKVFLAMLDKISGKE